MKDKLKEKLEYHYNAFDKTKIEPDPLQFLHRFSNPADIELIGFISSVFAYGNVTQIIKTIEKITAILGAHPVDFLLKSNRGKIQKAFNGVVHRFYSEEDVVTLFLVLKSVYKEYGMIKNLFLKFYHSGNENLRISISLFSKAFITIAEKEKRNITHGVVFMCPAPEKGSACKRMNLFLRWMVRKDELDFGLWNEIPASKLIIPVDTHIARICKQLNLTSRKNADWKMAEEITANFKKYDPHDPVKYDFAICHIGMRKLDF
jgi:uncharacterized protein (TIGR02757 family)